MLAKLSCGGVTRIEVRSSLWSGKGHAAQTLSWLSLGRSRYPRDIQAFRVCRRLAWISEGPKGRLGFCNHKQAAKVKAWYLPSHCGASGFPLKERRVHHISPSRQHLVEGTGALEKAPPSYSWARALQVRPRVPANPLARAMGGNGQRPLGRSGQCLREASQAGGAGPHLSLLFRATISRPKASLLSVASSSSRCSFLRLALMRWASSSASSSCRFSCFTRALALSAWGRGQQGLQSQPQGSESGPGVSGRGRWKVLPPLGTHLVLVLLGLLPLILRLQQSLFQLLVLLAQGLGCCLLFSVGRQKGTQRG